MKKLIALCLGGFLSLTSFCACAVHTGGDGGHSVSNSNDIEISESTSMDVEESDNVINETSYTVELSLDGSKFIPDGNTYVQWTRITETGDVTGFTTANFGQDGVAFANGLDGEYRVTLGNVPDGYAYNPNLYVSSGNSKNIVIELYPIIPTTAKGTDWYDDVIQIRKEGVYRIEIPKLFAPKEGVCFQFSIPADGGVYAVQSIVDVMQDTINPIAEIYTGSAQYKTWSYTCDDGVEFENGSYTKNFYFEGKATEDQEGYAIIPFALRANTNTGGYPVTVDFLVYRVNDYPSNHENAELIYAQECPTEKAPEGVGEWVGAETYENGQWKFNGDNYVYNEEDGFYHVGTKDGPYLYVDLAVKPQRFLPDYYPPGSNVGIPVSFVDIESIAPTAFLRVAQLDKATGEPVLRFNETTGEYTKKLIHYKPMIEEQYALVCNSDGRCLLTEELRWFLQELSESQQYFNDGFGWIETHSIESCGYSISALEDDQWLFACGYYKQ